MINNLAKRREIFIAEYPKDRNATQAAIRAGYSPRTAYSQGSRLLKKLRANNASIDVLLEDAYKQSLANLLDAMDSSNNERIRIKAATMTYKMIELGRTRGYLD